MGTTKIDFDNFPAVLMPGTEPIKEDYLWAMFGVGIEGCRGLYYAASIDTALEIVTNQIKPNINLNEFYFVMYPSSNNIDVTATNQMITTNFEIVHYGAYPRANSQSIAVYHLAQLLNMFHNQQNRWIRDIVASNSTFTKWSDDNSVIQQLISYIAVTYFIPYPIAEKCFTDKN